MSNKKGAGRAFRFMSCTMCGKTLVQNAAVIRRYFDGSVYRFDSESCLLIFQKLRDVYGRGFFKPGK